MASPPRRPPISPRTSTQPSAKAPMVTATSSVVPASSRRSSAPASASESRAWTGTARRRSPGWTRTPPPPGSRREPGRRRRGRRRRRRGRGRAVPVVDHLGRGADRSDRAVGRRTVRQLDGDRRSRRGQGGVGGVEVDVDPPGRPRHLQDRTVGVAHGLGAPATRSGPGWKTASPSSARPVSSRPRLSCQRLTARAVSFVNSSSTVSRAGRPAPWRPGSLRAGGCPARRRAGRQQAPERPAAVQQDRPCPAVLFPEGGASTDDRPAGRAR